MITTLSQSALDVIDLYLALPFSRPTTIPCPYFNNKRVKVRAALGVCVGKGSPEEIVQEAELTARKEHINLNDVPVDVLKKFLVEHGLGIDCSGLAYHILDAEAKVRTQKALKNILQFPLAKGVRRAIVKLRPIENTGVKSLAHEKNSHAISHSDVMPGDCIVMLDSTTPGNPDHLLIIHAVEKDANNRPTKMHYSHALNWSTDGPYGGHVRQGTILMTDMTRSLLEQDWVEEGKSHEQNETWQRAKDSTIVSVQRLKAFT